MEYIDEIVKHAWLIVGLVIGAYWLIKRIAEAINGAKAFVNHIIDERLPRTMREILPGAIKDTLSNGGGEIIRRIIKSENDEQSRIHDQKLDERFSKHEKQEDDRFKLIEAELVLLKKRRR